jgi:hypothetical protein
MIPLALFLLSFGCYVVGRQRLMPCLPLRFCTLGFAGAAMMSAIVNIFQMPEDLSEISRFQDNESQDILQSIKHAKKLHPDIKKALVLYSLATANPPLSQFPDRVRAACKDSGVELDFLQIGIFDPSSGSVIPRPPFDLDEPERMDGCELLAGDIDSLLAKHPTPLLISQLDIGMNYEERILPMPQTTGTPMYFQHIQTGHSPSSPSDNPWVFSFCRGHVTSYPVPNAETPSDPQ